MMTDPVTEDHNALFGSKQYRVAPPCKGEVLVTIVVMVGAQRVATCDQVLELPRDSVFEISRAARRALDTLADRQRVMAATLQAARCPEEGPPDD